MTSTTTNLRENDHLIESDKVEGTNVYNPQGDKLGTVKRFMVDKVSGRAEFAVMEFGGLFGIGTDHYPLPWATLRYDTDLGGYVVNLTEEQIRSAPKHGEVAPAYDLDFRDRVVGYYGSRPAPFI